MNERPYFPHPHTLSTRNAAIIRGYITDHKTIRQLAAENKITAQRIHQILEANKIERRRKGWTIQPSPAQQKLREKVLAVAELLRERKKLSYVEMSRKLNMPYQNTRYLCKKLGILTDYEYSKSSRIEMLRTLKIEGLGTSQMIAEAHKRGDTKLSSFWVYSHWDEIWPEEKRTKKWPQMKK